MEKYKKLYKNNKFKLSAPTYNEEFDLPGGSYSVWDIQDYFGYSIKKQKKFTENPPFRIYVIKIENRITFKIKIEYCLEFLTP